MTLAIDIGTTSAGTPATLDLEELLATRLLVQGNSGSGKSHLLRRLLEQSAPWVQQAVIDPEGDFVTLSERFGHVVVDADRSESEIQRIARRVRQHRVSVVLNLENLDAEAQMRAAAVFLNALFDADREQWFPMLVVVDEAQLFAPTASGETAEEVRRLSLGAMTNLMCRGRKRGLAGVIATQRLAKLAKNVAAEASNFLMGRTFLDIDMARAADLLGLERRQAEMFRDLQRGQFVALGPAVSKRPLSVRIGPVETSGRSASPVLLPLPAETPDAGELLFAPAGDDERESRPAITRRPIRPSVDDVLVQLSDFRPAPPPALPGTEAAPTDGVPAEPPPPIETVLGEMLSEPEAAMRTTAVLYQDFTTRMRRFGGTAPSLAEFSRSLAIARAEAGQAVQETPEWQKALACTADLAEDLHGVFLAIARAAIEGAPCPSDDDLAAIYGTTSPGRARRLLLYLEERGLILSRIDFRKRRSIALPPLGVETAPGLPLTASAAGGR
ncbi:MAG TPA: DUF87 domain-containing protein [Beijerinckiaceae bacterium]|nr:DUF87 domain-containing protein [Beijerinckiaceae bacterium]